MKKFCLLLALASVFPVTKASAILLDDVQLWTGSGTNRAALVIEWSTPESLTNSSVPVPVADKALVWGYRFNGSATATEMLKAILKTDPKLYVVADDGFGTFVQGIGYNLNGNGIIGITDGSGTNYFTNGMLINATVDMDAAHAINGGDLYWGGMLGASWEVWNELGDAGGFLASPNRGTNEYWTPTDTVYFAAGTHGQWEYAQAGLDNLPLTNGSWIGFSVTAGEFEPDPTSAYDIHKHAPPSPDGTYIAYVCDTNDFAIQVISTNNVYTVSPYNDPAAMLGRPTLKFLDHYGDRTAHGTKIVEPPYWTDPSSNNVITEISSGGQITVNMGRKIYDNPANPYGIDFIVYGNSFFSASGYSGSEANDGTDLDLAKLSSGIYGHPAIVSVSQDGTNWFSYPNTAVIFPDNAYRWDETNHSWTDEQMNPTKPLNPFIYTNNFGGDSVASGLDQFAGAAGGSGYDLKDSGLPWIQYVRIQPGAGTYTVIDAIAAVNPVVVGDAVCISPDNLASGISNLVFQKPDDSTKTLISINVDSVSGVARFSTVTLNEFSSFAPVIGNVSSAYQITLKPVTDSTISCTADIGLSAGEGYSGDGSDLHVFGWNGTNWTSQPFTFNAADNQALVAGVTNFSAFVVSQIIRPQLSIQAVANGFAFQFTPVPNATHILERSADFANWTAVTNIVATNALPITLQDNTTPGAKEFYRLRLSIP